MEIDMSIVYATAVIAFLGNVIPPFKRWWDANVNHAQKQLAVIVVAVLIVLASLGYNCYFTGVCPADWVKTVIDNFLAGLVGLIVGYNSTKYIGEQFAYGKPE